MIRPIRRLFTARPMSGALVRGARRLAPRFLRLALVSMVLSSGVFSASAWALAGGVGSVEPSPDTPWAGVGSLSVKGQLFSAVLIGPQHVLTAAHIVSGAPPADIRFRIALGNGYVGEAVSVHLHPAFNRKPSTNVPGDPSVHADLAIVRLKQPAPAQLPIARLFNGFLFGRTITLISHGRSTSQITQGENRVDVVFPDTTGRPTTYLFDYDGPELSSNRIGPAEPVNGTLGARREASLISGDSGSAAFVNADGQWWLAGINTFQISIGGSGAGAFGSGAGGMVLSGLQDWVDRTLAEPLPSAIHPDTPVNLR